MKNIVISIIALLMLLISGKLPAQSLLSQGKISGNMQIDAQSYSKDSLIGAPAVDEKLLSNIFANLLYTNGNFNAGVRFEAYLGPMLGFDKNYSGHGIPFWFANWKNEQFDITIGSIYEQFGSGVLLRSYEERNLGFDNSIRGVRLKMNPYKGITIKGIIGTQRYYWKDGPGLVRGIDGEISLNDLIKNIENSKTRITVGGSFVSKFEANQKITFNDQYLTLPLNVGAWASRVRLSNGGLNIDAEYAYKMNDPSSINNFKYKNGNAILMQMSYSQKGFGAMFSAKRTENMSFKSRRSETTNMLDINYLPAITRQHTYALSAMYPYATQPNGELALQGQINYMIKKGSIIGGKYGTNIAVNYSKINGLKNKKNPSMIHPYNNPLYGTQTEFLQFGKLYFSDFNIEVQRKLSSKFKALLSYVRLNYNIEVIEGHVGAKDIKADIIIADMTYKINKNNAIKVEVQHLGTKEDKKNWVMGLVEYTIAPKWFFTLSDQYNYNNNIKEQRLHYPLIAAGYTHGTSRLSVSYGKQREGIVCVGGVCRAVPASNGIAFTLTSSF